MSKKHKELAEEYLEMLDSKAVFMEQIENMLFEMACVLPPSEADELKELRSVLTWDAIEETVVSTIMETFPEKVLADAIAFYKTESGRFIGDHMMDLVRNINLAMRSFLEEQMGKCDTKTLN